MRETESSTRRTARLGVLSRKVFVHLEGEGRWVRALLFRRRVAPRRDMPEAGESAKNEPFRDKIPRRRSARLAKGLLEPNLAFVRYLVATLRSATNQARHGIVHNDLELVSQVLNRLDHLADEAAARFGFLAGQQNGPPLPSGSPTPQLTTQVRLEPLGTDQSPEPPPPSAS